MNSKIIFNATVCLLGTAILLVHIINLSIKKNKRKDEICLLIFFAFTAIHFMTYFTFTMIKRVYTSDELIKAFYTIFYIMNNMEVFILFYYMIAYITIPEISARKLSILNLIAFGIFVVLDVINIFTGLFFTAVDGEYTRSKLMFLSQGYQLEMFIVIFIVTITNKRLNVTEKAAFSIYCFLPLVAIVLQNIFKGYAIAYASIIISIELLFVFLTVQKNMKIAEEEEKSKDAQIKLMLSQIQPHFIYNSLSSISTMIDLDPERAQKSLDDFTDYLRSNLSSLSETRMIPFEDELKHIKSYVSLEKLRFNERINVIYDIKALNFNVPPLTIQPLVENAIKHGILKKLEGGTVTLSTYETETTIVIKVKDDGIGFDFDKIDFSRNEHIGLMNIKYRIEKMCNGEMIIDSKENVGTTVIVAITK